VDKLELHLNSLIVFLQELSAPSVSGPGRAVALAPFIGEWTALWLGSGTGFVAAGLPAHAVLTLVA
jgi:hypothetical protein